MTRRSQKLMKYLSFIRIFKNILLFVCDKPTRSSNIIRSNKSPDYTDRMDLCVEAGLIWGTY